MFSPTEENTDNQPKVFRFQSDHLEQVYRIENSSFPDPFSKHYLAELSRQYPETFLVAIKDVEVLGYALAEAHHDQAHILSLAVKEEWRRKHIALKLMHTLIECLRTRKVKQIALEVRVGNIAARRLYEELGFELASTIRAYYRNEENAAVYYLKL